MVPTWCTIWGAGLSLDFNDSIIVDCVTPVPAAFPWNPLRTPERLETLAAVSFAITPRGPRLSLTCGDALYVFMGYGIWLFFLNLIAILSNKNLLFHELGYWSIMMFDTTCTVDDTRRAHRSSCSESGLILAGEVIRKVWADQAARSRLEKKPFVSASLVAVESLPPWTIGERILKHFLSWFWVRKVHLCTDGRRHTVPLLWKRAQPHWDLLRILCSSPPAPFLVLFQRLVVCRRRSHMRTNRSIGK